MGPISIRVRNFVGIQAAVLTALKMMMVMIILLIPWFQPHSTSANTLFKHDVDRIFDKRA